MAIHIDVDDPEYRNAAAEILRRHNNGEPQANITSVVRDFLIFTGLARSEEMVEENPPSDASRRAVDLTALDTFIEFKRRVGTASGGAPNPQYVDQLDDYLAQSEKQGRVRMGVLTDGKRWLLRWPGAGEVRLARPYAFTLEEPNHWIGLYEWLRDSALVSLEGVSPDREGITGHFGPGSPSYQRDIAALKTLYQENAKLETVGVKRRLWYDLLRTTLGEIAYTTEGMSEDAQARLAAVGVGDEEMDDLFVRHTYLGAIIGMVVQASFGIDIRRLAETNPADLLQGQELYRATGLQGVLESDFFAWPNEVDGKALLQTLARRVARFNWAEAPPDTAATLYESVIPSEERRQLGEYYTPDWLARAMIRELVDDPLNQRGLDPAYGSGTFIAAAGAANWKPREVLNRLREAVTGIDVHPVAVHLARAAWTLAARPAISNASAAGYDASLSIPVYLGDALQLRFRTGDLFAEHNITVQVEGEENTDDQAVVVAVLERVIRHRPELLDTLLNPEQIAVEKRVIQLPHSGEVTLSVIHVIPGTYRTMDILEQMVRTQEGFMAVPFPRSYVGLLAADAIPVGGGPSGIITVGSRSAENRYLIAHELAHTYWSFFPPWLREGAADFMTTVSAGTEFSSNECSLADNLSDLDPLYVEHVGSGLSEDIIYRSGCSYALGRGLFLDLYETLGDEAFREGFRRLYLTMRSTERDDQCTGLERGVCYVRVAFVTDGLPESAALAEPVIAHWYYGPTPETTATPTAEPPVAPPPESTATPTPGSHAAIDAMPWLADGIT